MLIFNIILVICLLLLTYYLFTLLKKSKLFSAFILKESRSDRRSIFYALILYSMVCVIYVMNDFKLDSHSFYLKSPQLVLIMALMFLGHTLGHLND